MKDAIQNIKTLIEKNELEAAIHELIGCIEDYNLEESIGESIWSKQSLQNLILNESKGEFMHWSNTYEMVSNIETLNAPWFYRDETGSFHNIKEDYLNETLQKIEVQA